MFICKDCKKNLNLTKQGKEWIWPDSEGPCESCEIVIICEDISSQYDWAWADDINSDADLITYTQCNLKKRKEIKYECSSNGLRVSTPRGEQYIS